MYEQAFKNIDKALRNDAGCSSELDYIEQTSWILFLKYLDDYESEREDAAILNGEVYARILETEFSWKTWAAPKREDGSPDINAALTGDDLTVWVNERLFPYLSGFKKSAEAPDTIQYKIGEIFSEIDNSLKDGYELRNVIEQVDTLSFLSNENKHELSSLYEDKIKKMGNAGRNGGEYYTPRPLIKAIVKVVNPVIGETVYDGAAGSAGFLCEAYEHLRTSKELTGAEYERLQKRTLLGKEKKSLAYVIGLMNMILHGIEAPTILHTNTLSENTADIQDKDRVDVVLANPPFGSDENKQVQHNFSIKSGEPAYLFLQHFIKMLKINGRAGVVIKNTFLSNTDNASIALRKELLTECNLHTILDLPGGTFTGAGVKTVVLFFDRGTKTDKIWYYQLDPGRNLGKTNPLNDKDLAEFLEFQQDSRESEKSWSIDVADIDQATFDLTVSNPNKVEEVDNRTPQEIIAEIELLDAQASEALQAIKELL